jgi:hypothetical protein
MANKKRKAKRAQLTALTRPQLVALAVQKTDLTYQGALDTGTDALVEMFMEIDGILKPQRTDGVEEQETTEEVAD